jgi:hypothetical protein
MPLMKVRDFTAENVSDYIAGRLCACLPFHFSGSDAGLITGHQGFGNV